MGHSSGLKLGPGEMLLTVLALGLMLAAAGVIHGVGFVGVPSPDPTPAQAETERLHLSVSGWGRAAGAGLALSALLGLAMLGARRALRRCPSLRSHHRSRHR